MRSDQAKRGKTLETPELRLLFACARTDSRIASEPNLLKGNEGGIDWQKFVELAQAHHVMPLTHKSLNKLTEMVPENVRRVLAEGFQYNTRRNLFLLGELARLIDLCAEHKIGIVPFKGPVLALQVYRDVALRQCGDLDVLIRPNDVPAAKKMLLERGQEMMFPTSTPREAAYLASMNAEEEAQYIRCHSEYHLYRSKDGLNIDLHWRLNPPEMTVAFNEEALWRRLETFPLAGRQVLRLGPADQLLLLCFNGAKDCWKRLDRICDIAELLRSHPKTDWRDALMRARSIGVERMVLVGLALAENLLDAPLSEELSAALRKDPAVRGLVPKLRRELATPTELLELQGRLAPTFLHLKLRERWSDRVRYCAARLSPTVGDWVAVPLPASLSFLYYVLRPVRLAGRFGMSKLRMK